jgi:serine phosphatase RsbU (regulator of sigma subunit)
MNNLSQPVSAREIGVLASLGNPQPRTAPSLSSGIQNTLVPPLTYRGARVEARGQSIPKGDVGGDLVDLVADGQDVMTYVADVSGHGLRAGVLMGMIKTAVRYGLLLRQPVAKVLQDLNRVLPSIKEPHMFATLAALRFDRSNVAGNVVEHLAENEVEYVSAGHVPLLHYRRRSRDVVRYCTPQFPLGLFAGADYVSRRIRYEAGDIFALVTDGVVEVGEDRDADLGFERLAQILLQLPERPLSEIVEAIFTDLKQHEIQQDDQTVLLVRAVAEHDAHQHDSAPTHQNQRADSPEPLEARWRKLLDDLAAELARN